MAHDDPVAGLTVDADWAHDLSRATTYTPALTASTTDPDLGADGVATGFYHLNGHLVIGWARFLFSGSGLSAGSGRFQISLPIDADTSLMDASPTGGAGSVIGAGRLRDQTTSSNSMDVNVNLETASTAWMTQDGTNSSVDEATPISWGEGDRISVFFSYIADSSAL